MDGLWQPVCHALWNFNSTGLRGLSAGRAHCAMPILRAKNVGQVGLVGLVGRLAQGAVRAMCCEISKAHGWQRAMCQLSIMSIMSIMSIFTAPTLCIAQCALPANRTHSPVLSKFQSTWLTRILCPSSVQVRTSPYSLAPTLYTAQCALPVFRRLESPSGRQPTVTEADVRPERHVCRCQPTAPLCFALFPFEFSGKPSIFSENPKKGILQK